MLGTGLIKGLAVTAKNLVGSFHDPKRFVTTEYPEQRTSLPENYRNFPFLVFDGEKPIEGLRCVACRICETECPPQCIYIIPERDEKGRPAKKPKIFDIDLSVCMSCQICVEVCPFDAIKMDQQYEIATADRFNGLLRHREELAKPNSYFHQLHPTEAAGVDARLDEVKRANEEKAKAAKAATAAATPAAAGTTANAGTPLAAKDGRAGTPLPAAPGAERSPRPTAPQPPAASGQPATAKPTGTNSTQP